MWQLNKIWLEHGHRNAEQLFTLTFQLYKIIIWNRKNLKELNISDFYIRKASWCYEKKDKMTTAKEIYMHKYAKFTAIAR